MAKRLYVFDHNSRAKRQNEVNYNYSKIFDINKNARLLKTYEADGGHSSTAAYGGETIPTPLADRFIDIVKKNTFCRQIFRVFPMPGATFEIPRKTTATTVYRGGEGRDMTTEGGVAQGSSSISRTAWDSITLTANKFNVLSGYSTELSEDSLLNWAQLTLQDMALQMAYAEEKAIIQGEAAGTTTGWGAGDVRYAFDGLVWQTYGTNASTGTNWTPDNASPVMWADGGSDKLTNDELQQLVARIEDQRFRCKYLVMRPMVHARMRDHTEFEMFQGLKDIGNAAALVKGFVGRYYTADIISSPFIPVGTSNGFAGTGLEFVTNAADTMVLGFDNSEPIIGDRRKLEMRKRHSFYVDVEEVRLTERIAFQVERPWALGGIADVKDSA